MTKKARKTKRRVAKRKTKRPGLPDAASVVSEATLRSPSGRTYRVLRTTERDPYDPPDKPRGKRR